MLLEIIEKMNAPSNRNCPLRAAFRGFVIAFRNRHSLPFHSDAGSIFWEQRRELLCSPPTAEP